MSNRSNGNKKKKKVRFNAPRFVVTVLLAFMIGGVFVSVKNIVMLHLEKKELQEYHDQLEAEKSNKKNELKSINDLDYIEEQARRQLKMIKPGEVIYILDEDAKNSSEDKEHEESEN